MPLPTSPWAVTVNLDLFIAPLGGHPILPAFYRDMRHPHKYPTAIRTTYSFTFSLNITMTALGCMMFGHAVCNEVTANILDPTAGYSPTISRLIMLLIGTIPITKMPLANQPIIDVVNRKCFSSSDTPPIDPNSEKSPTSPPKSHITRLGRITTPIAINILQLTVAYTFPNFDAIMLLMGSLLCVTTCVLLPVTFYLRIFWRSAALTAAMRMWLMALVAVSAALGVAGVVGASVQ